MPVGSVVVISVVGGSRWWMVVDGSARVGDGGGSLMSWGWKMWVVNGFRERACGAWEFLGWLVAGSGVGWVEGGAFFSLGVEGPSPRTKCGGTMGLWHPYGSVFCGLSCNGASWFEA